LTNIGRGAVVLAVVALGLWLPTLFFDDAYITFRYAANLARGDGFTWNPPERVLGVTTPLFTLMLAGGARLGIDIEDAALILGLAGHALLCLLVFAAVPMLVPGWPKPVSVWLRTAAALACALHPHMAFTAVGGMETPLYCALILGTLLAAARGRELAAGLLLGAALLTRPDAIVLAPVALWLVWTAAEGPHTLPILRTALLSGAMAGGWTLFAVWYFGSAIPHSAVAKRLIHPAAPAQVLGDFATFLRDDAFLMVALPVALAGVWLQRKAPLTIAMSVFAALYLAACALSGVEPFPWYVNPLIPIVLVLAVAGLAALLEKVRASRAAIWAGVAILVVALLGASIAGQAAELSQRWEEWEGAYELAARWIVEHSRPGDRVFVGETGVIGYLLEGRVVIDSSGINSPEVLRRRRGRSETDPEWSRRVIRDLAPDFITTSPHYLNIRTIAAEPWFGALYVKVSPPLLEQQGQLIYRRRSGRG
jgi:hypothetical protein